MGSVPSHSNPIRGNRFLLLNINICKKIFLDLGGGSFATNTTAAKHFICSFYPT